MKKHIIIRDHINRDNIKRENNNRDNTNHKNIKQVLLYLNVRSARIDDICRPDFRDSPP